MRAAAVSSARGNVLVSTYNPYEHGSLWLYPLAEWEQELLAGGATTETVEVVTTEAEGQA